MLVMESVPSLPHSSLKHKQSGYEPSDTESECHDSPWLGVALPNRSKTPDPVRPISPFQIIDMQTPNLGKGNPSTKGSRTSQRDGRQDRSPRKPMKEPNDALSSHANPDLRINSRKDHANTSRTSQISRARSISPYKPTIIGDANVSSRTCFDPRRKGSADEASEPCKQVSPYRAVRSVLAHRSNGLDGSVRKRDMKTPPKYPTAVDKRGHSKLEELSRISERSNSSRSRSLSASKPRAIEMNQDISPGRVVRAGSKSPLPPRAMRKKGSHRANAASQSQDKINGTIGMQSVESIAPGDIFFSLDCTVPQKKNEKNSGHENIADYKVVAEKNIDVGKPIRRISSLNEFLQSPILTTPLSRTSGSVSAVSRPSSGILSNDSSKVSDISGKLSKSFRKFAAERQRSQGDAWFSCVKKGPCRNSKSPEPRVINEASFIEKAFVVEELRPFWADKHRPRSLGEFVCHKQQAVHLKQLISRNICPHILLTGPPGSGKKSLCRALLHDIFGNSSGKISHYLRQFHIQETNIGKIVVPLTSSPHHVELDLKTGAKNGISALMTLVKEISASHALNHETSDTSFKAYYKVIVLYNVDKVEESLQHLIKWAMDCYIDVCKIMICCEHDTDILDSVKNRCKLVAIDAPATHEIMEVLLHIAKEEKIELPVTFASRIASRSKQNMRGAIMALEACKTHNYPFVDEQPIPVGWEEILMELASDILADPSPKRLFFTRGKFQKLLVDCVDPKIILQKLVEQFIKGIETGLKREVYYWHAYYVKRLPNGTSALLKLEEFVAKFMSIYRNRNRTPVSVLE